MAFRRKRQPPVKHQKPKSQHMKSPKKKRPKSKIGAKLDKLHNVILDYLQKKGFAQVHEMFKHEIDYWEEGQKLSESGIFLSKIQESEQFLAA